MRFARVLVGILAPLVFAACEIGDPLGPTDYIGRMRREYPTELPAIDYAGERVFGANVVTDTGVVLYVASGVDRSGAFFGPYRGEGCLAYQTFGYDAASRSLGVQSRYCARPEIGDPRSMNMGLFVSDTGRHHMYFTYDENQLGYRAKANAYTTQGLAADAVRVTYVKRDTTPSPPGNAAERSAILAGTFSAMLVERELRLDTIWVRDGRFSCLVRVE